MANVAQDLKAKLFITASNLVIAAESGKAGAAGVPIDPKISDPNLRNLNIEVGEEFKIYTAFVDGAFALHGKGDAFADPVLIPDGGSAPSPAGPTPALQATSPKALLDHHCDKIMKSAISEDGKKLAAHLAKVLKGN